MPTVTDYTALLSGESWRGQGVANKPVFVTYSFEARPQEYLADYGYSGAYARSFQAFTPDQRTAALVALKAWGGACGIVFLEAPAGQGDVRFANYDFTEDPFEGEAAGYAYYPGVHISKDYAYTFDIGGDVFLNLASKSYSADDLTHVLLHEIGHALGLKHPFDGSVTLRPSHDDGAHTVMSYADYEPRLGSLDDDAVRHLYGRDGDDGRQVADWSWSGRTHTLTQVGREVADTIKGVSTSDRMSGLGGNDVLFGAEGTDALDGGAGDDALLGGDGDDTLLGGAGDDALHGGSGYEGAGDGGDTADYSASRSGVEVDLDGSSFVRNGRTVWYNARGADVGTDVFTSVENVLGGRGDDALTGDVGANALSGWFGRDTLAGGGGSDVLNGGAGTDALSGGRGLDRFVFDQALTARGADVISDFSTVQDTVVLGGAVFAGLNEGGLRPSAFRIGTARDADDRILYDRETGRLSFDGDGAGGQDAIAFAVIDAGLDLRSTDFLVA